MSKNITKVLPNAITEEQKATICARAKNALSCMNLSEAQADAVISNPLFLTTVTNHLTEAFGELSGRPVSRRLQTVHERKPSKENND